MPKPRKIIPDIAERIKDGRKKFVRYDEGAVLYSMGYQTFRKLAIEAEAVYHIKGFVLVNTDIIDDFLESFRDL